MRHVEEACDESEARGEDRRGQHVLLHEAAVDVDDDRDRGPRQLLVNRVQEVGEDRVARDTRGLVGRVVGRADEQRGAQQQRQLGQKERDEVGGADGRAEALR